MVTVWGQRLSKVFKLLRATVNNNNNVTYKRLVLRPGGLHNDDWKPTIVSGLDDESVVGPRVLEPCSNFARDLERVPGAGRARSQVYRPASDHRSDLRATVDDSVDE